MTTTLRNKSKPPQQVTVLGRDLAVLRKINPRKLGSNQRERENLMAMLATTQLEPGMPEGEMPWFADDYVANDMPRSQVIAQRLIAATIGFAVARTDTGEILETFGPDKLAKAERAIAGAKLQLDIDFDFSADDDEDEEPEPEQDAAPVNVDEGDEPQIAQG